MMNKLTFFLFVTLVLLCASCASTLAPAPAAASPQPKNPPTLAATQPVAQETAVFTSTPAPATAGTATPTLAPDAWKEMPVLPTINSDTVRKIYAHGQQLGNNPKAFSKVGDSNSELPEFLGDFDKGKGVYKLGPYTDLQPVIDQFAGSWGRQSLAQKIGLSTNGVLSPLWADWKSCSAKETPLSCEYRVQKPSFALIELGTNDAYDAHTEPLEKRFRTVIETTLSQGIVPILFLKVDNIEKDNLVNQMITRLAYEYDLPVVNTWRAMQGLPGHGLDSPFHYTQGQIGTCEFDDPQNMKYGWTVRNLTAVQALDLVWRAASGQ
jgi:hypothetical protein